MIKSEGIKGVPTKYDGFLGLRKQHCRSDSHLDLHFKAPFVTLLNKLKIVLNDLLDRSLFVCPIHHNPCVFCELIQLIIELNTVNFVSLPLNGNHGFIVVEHERTHMRSAQ
jgi:hypothetical protein